MKNGIVSFIDSLKSNKKLQSFDEASTKQAIVMKLLSLLDWDVFDVDEVVPDYSVKSNQVDFLLKPDGVKKVFISVKKIGESLESHQKGFLDFALQEKIDIAVLTNGIVWFFYLPSQDGSPDQKKFFSTDFLKAEAEEIGEPIKDFLEKSKISSGIALKAAEAVFENQRQKLAVEAIPQAWNQIISEKNKILVQLLSETSEKICGYKAEKESIIKFMDEYKESWKIAIKTVSKQEASAKKQAAAGPAPTNYNNEQIESFAFKNITYKVSSWDEFLPKLSDTLVSIHKEDFDKVLWLSGGKNRSFFSKSESDLRNPEKIKHTGIYVDISLNPNDMVKLAYNVIGAFGYANKDLVIMLQKK